MPQPYKYRLNIDDTADNMSTKMTSNKSRTEAKIK